MSEVFDNRPIGVFDSGLGGLTSVRALEKYLPCENIIYFGDTGRVPYGTKSRETQLSVDLIFTVFSKKFNVRKILQNMPLMI